MGRKHLALIDGNSLLYRSFYALPALTNASGTPTNAVYGFLLMLVKLYEELRPDYIAVAFDKGRVTFRNQVFSEYKGHRPDAPEDLVPQFNLIREVLGTLGIAVYEEEGYEGDDLIGTIATKLCDQCHVDIITGDKDALQLVREGITVHLTQKGISQMRSVTPDTMVAEYGIGARQVVDMKALMGDASDAIPGVPGVGEKTALKLLGEFSSLDDIYENVDAISGKKLKENLLNYKEQAYLSQLLAKIKVDVPMDIDLADMVQKARRQEVATLFERLGFKNVLQKLQVAGLVDEENLFSFGAEDAEASSVYEVQTDCSTSILNGMEEVYVAFLVAGETPSKQVTHLVVQQAGSYYGWKAEAAREALRILLGQETKMVVYQAKEVYQVAGYYTSFSEVIDVQIGAYVLEPTRTSYPLSYLAEKYGTALSEWADINQNLAQKTTVLKQIWSGMEKELENARALDLFLHIEMPLTQVLAAMETNGIAVDLTQLKRIRADLKQRIEEMEQAIFEMAGESFNILSPKQLGQVLFEVLALPPAKKTKTGYSTDAEVLEGLREKHPIISRILEYRTLTKLVSTYLDGIETLISPKTGRIHTSFNQTVTATGRLSSSDPNLQNIPVRTPEGRRIRSIFVPGEGYDGFLSADYSQIELRVLAHISGDEGLQKAFLENEDIHRRTAAEVLHIAPEEVTSVQRSHAKAVNFGIIYGISDYGLAKDLGISRQEAAAYIDRYLARYPKVKAYMEEMVRIAKEQGRVETMFGRFRVLPDIHSKNFNRRSFAERTALNTPIQGTAADIMKIAMNRVYWGLIRGGYKSRLLLQVHDELIVETCESERVEVADLMKRYMEMASDMSVPLVIDIHYGQNWEAAK